MTKEEFLKQSFEEILKLQKTNNVLRKEIQGEYLFSIALKKFGNEQIIELINTNPEILTLQNENSVPYVEVLANLGKVTVLENFSDKINLLQTSSDGQKNMLGYFLKKGLNNLVIKCLESNAIALNKSDPIGCMGTERMADANFSTGLELFANHIDLLQTSYNGEKNMLGYLAKKGMSNVIEKALEANPSALNKKDSIGYVGTERLADAGYTKVLEKFANHIDLLQTSYNGQKNMLGYLISKGMTNVVEKALEANPSVLNEKDSIGCVGTERLADAGYSTILQKFSHHIDLLKTEYKGEKNMLGYLVSKGMGNVVEKALEANSSALNEKDSIGCVGTERLADAGYTNILEKFATSINLLKSDYRNKYNMLGYLAKKGMSNVLIKSIEVNPAMIINQKDSSDCTGVERLTDTGYISIINQFSPHINWSKKATNDQSLLQYVLKRANQQTEEIAMKALRNNNDLLAKEIKFIIDSGMSKILSYQEIVSKLNKNMQIENMNLLGYLINKGQEKYVDIILNPEKATCYFQNKDDHILKIDEEKEKVIKNIQLNKEVIINKLKKEEEQIETPVPKSIKAKIKSIL